MSTMKEELEKAINETGSMREACKKLNMTFSTFKRNAIKYELYNPNQPGLGLIKSKKDLNDVFEGKQTLTSGQLRRRLIKEGYFEAKCSECSLTDWNNKPITLELDHINGNNQDNSLPNLRILCPNCHSQTPTFRRKKT